MSHLLKPHSYAINKEKSARNIIREGSIVGTLALAESDVSGIVRLLNESYSLGHVRGRLEAFTECTDSLRAAVHKL